MKWAGLALLLLAFAAPHFARAQPVTLFDGGAVAPVLHEPGRTMALAAQLLQRDLAALTGVSPPTATSLQSCSSLCIVIGQKDSALVRAVAADGAVDLRPLEGQWERYIRVLVPSRRHPGRAYLLIAGSDPRGAVWGVTDLSRDLGVSPWEWWADVTPRRTDRLVIDGAWRLSNPPSVRYRGIFLNDEDWGLQPWAARTFEPETGDIGPKTYAKIFELLWRLKANMVWPAMHDVTRPFYTVAGNARTADDYAIIVGTSHAEPMMRNNVREWRDAWGAFNYVENKPALLRYWRDRVRQVAGHENIYTLGLRGRHDSGMEGVDSAQAARDVTADVIAQQRRILTQETGRPAAQLPQVMTLYKEVLDTYRAGLNIPDDVTIVWPDDNYGYLHQLSTAQEQQRPGGAGIYYHLSYWGRPHDYTWLSSTHPALVREQLDRAWRTQARRLWVANVGDIKPGEFLMQYFLDIAFDSRLLADPPRAYLRRWAERQFGPQAADAVADVMRTHFDLAFPRRPEFMGWGQTEPTRPNAIGDYVRTGGEEAERRLADYAALVDRTDRLAALLPADRRDAFFQMVGYNVRSAANINDRMLTLDLAVVHAKQHRTDMNRLSDQARAAHARIVADTAAYNAQRNGKWRHMMSMTQRDLPVFQEPFYPKWDIPAGEDCARTQTPSCRSPAPATLANRILSLPAIAARSADWEAAPGLGSGGAALRSRLDLPSRSGPSGDRPLSYPFTTQERTDVTLRIVALPVHPLTSANRLRIAVRVDGGDPTILDYQSFGRSEEWKRNVLSNSATRDIRLPQLPAGAHRIDLEALDPGFLLDRIDVRLDGAPDYYGAPPVDPIRQ